MIVGPIQFTFMYCELRGSPTPPHLLAEDRVAPRRGVAAAVLARPVLREPAPARELRAEAARELRLRVAAGSVLRELRPVGRQRLAPGTRAARGGRRRPRRTSGTPRRPPCVAGEESDGISDTSRRQSDSARAATRPLPIRPAHGVPTLHAVPGLHADDPGDGAHAQRTLRAAAADPARDERITLRRGRRALGAARARAARAGLGKGSRVAALAPERARLGGRASSPRRGSAPSWSRSTPSTSRASSAACCATPTCSCCSRCRASRTRTTSSASRPWRRRSRGRRRARCTCASFRYLRDVLVFGRSGARLGAARRARSRPRPTRIPPSTPPSCARSRAASRPPTR